MVLEILIKRPKKVFSLLLMFGKRLFLVLAGGLIWKMITGQWIKPTLNLSGGHLKNFMKRD